MNTLTIYRKLIFFYAFCVILPLIVTDGFIIYTMNRDERQRQEYEFKNIATVVGNNITNLYEDILGTMNSIYLDKTINEFINTDYKQPYDYYSANYRLLRQSLAGSTFNKTGYNVSIYTDNPTVISGGVFRSIDSATGSEWYKAFLESNKPIFGYYYYGDSEQIIKTGRRNLCVLRKMNHFRNLGREVIIKTEVNYNELVRTLNSMNFVPTVYVCSGDTILLSNDGNSEINRPFLKLTGTEKIATESELDLHGLNLRIIILDPYKGLQFFSKRNIPILILLIVLNLLLPVLLVYVINSSLTGRFALLNESFDKIKGEVSQIKEINSIEGNDEISNLMTNYNLMVRRLKELIKTVYEDRLYKQEADIARQQAELLALHSQINPHFLFNVLESIRMLSLIKNEREIASMIEKLAILERQNVDWSKDCIKINEELKFVEAYLDLQKLRFEERLNYKISIKNGCENYYVPKLTLETFVENACVHGVENKSVPCWIYIRIYEQNETLFLEIEDTGYGMEDEDVNKMKIKMRDCTIEDLKEGQRVGIINACLRLKMITDNRVRFNVQSKRNMGTTFFISIPVDTLERTII
ncbi:MAG: histidine kinase [Lachnospiraceae bacterium]|nr:histidine kinase [Lachnospiraceae bacterium]